MYTLNNSRLAIKRNIKERQETESALAVNIIPLAINKKAGGRKDL